MKKSMLVAIGFASASVLTASPTFTEDFASRTNDAAALRRASKHWTSCAYTLGSGTVNPLAYSYIYGTYRYSPALPYSNAGQIQDGWVMGGVQGLHWVPGFFATTNAAAELPGDTGRPFAALSIGGGDSYWESRVMQPIGNSFSNGTVRYTIDFRAPSRWYRKGNGVAPMMRFYPATRQMLSCPDMTQGNGDSPCGFGMNGSSIGSAGYITDAYPLVIYGSGDSTSAIQGRDFGKAVALHWYRFSVDVNLDANTFSGTVGDLGDRVPDWGTAGTQVGTWADLPFWRVLTADTGPLEGLCIYNGGIFSSGNSVVTNMGCFKNISVAWKSPGATGFQPCYSNDFVVRRSCVVAPPNGESFARTASGAAWTTNSYTRYESFSWNVASTDARHIVNNAPGTSGGTLPGTDRYPVGIDGWRRLNSASGGYATVVAGGGASGNLLRLDSETSGNKFVICAQTLGESITSGKVRFTAVGRTPNGWYWGALSALYVALGDSDLCEATYTTDITQHYNGVVGFKGTTGSPQTCTPCVNILDNTATGQTGTALAGKWDSTWYKFALTADLDNNTMDCSIIKLKDNNILATEGDDVYSATGVPFLNNLNDIGSFALMGYGMGKGWDGSIVFDAIEVWKDVGTAGETRIYYNDFDRRERVVSTPQPDDDLADFAGLAATDGWWKNGGNFKVGGLSGNAFASATANAAAGINTAVKSFACPPVRTFSVRVDIRPPQKWQWNGARDASFAVGGDSFARGHFSGSDFLASAAIRLGFDDAGGANVNGTSQCRTLGIYAKGAAGKVTASGVAVDSTHWYRFAAVGNIAGRTYRFAVYDMGATQPGLTSEPSAAPVATFSGLSFASAADAEVSSLALCVAGTDADSPWFGVEDPGCALFDNIVVDAQPSPFFLIIR